MDFALEARPLFLPAGFVFPLSTFTQGRTAETPRCPVPTNLLGGVLQGIRDRAASSLQLPHLAHTLTALAIIFTEGLTANRSLLSSGAKIWFLGSAGRKTVAPEPHPLLRTFQLLRTSTCSPLQKWSKTFVFCAW